MNLRRAKSLSIFILLNIAYLFFVHCEPAIAEFSDEALLFSSVTTQRANAIIEEIRRNTFPPKEISIRTIPSLPSNDSDAKVMIERIFREQRITGIFLLVVKNPVLVLFSAGKNTLSRMGDAEQIRNAMLKECQAGNFDRGLLSGLRALGDELKNLFPRPKQASTDNRTTSPSRGSPSQWWEKLFPERTKSEPVVPPPSRGSGFKIPNSFFWVMFVVLAYMLIPWNWIGGRRFSPDRARYVIHQLLSRMKGSRISRNLAAATGKVFRRKKGR